MGQHLLFSIEMLPEETLKLRRYIVNLLSKKKNLPFHQSIVSLSFVKRYPYIDDIDFRIDFWVLGDWNEHCYKYFV